MDFTQIRFFLTLARTLNFTRAAELCHVTQPALTKSIQRLEIELGGPLLLRERNHTQLTALGQTMLPLLQETFDAAERARRGAKQFQEQDLATLRLGLGPRVEPSIVQPLVREVARRFPKVEVTVREGPGPRLNDWLLDSQLDIVLTEDVAILNERANRWPIYADTVVAVFAEDHDLAAHQTVDAQELKNLVLIGRAGAASDETEGDTGLEEIYALTRSIRHRATSERHVCALVQAVGGVALSTGRRALPHGLTSRVLEPRQSVPIWVAAMAGRPMSRAADAFLRLARARDWNE